MTGILGRDVRQTMQGLWIGPRLSAMEQLSIASFLANGHGYDLYCYEPVANVPEGAVLRDAGEILPRSRAFQYKEQPTWAGFANFFRYKLLLDRGGWWVDSDMICLAPFDSTDDYVFSSEFSLGKQMVNIGAILAPAGSELMEWLWGECQNKDTSKIVWGETGPALMGQGVTRFGLESHVRPWEVFCPVGFRDWRTLIDAADLELPQSSIAVHLWHEKWRASGQSTDAHYHPASLYERLRRRYLGANDRISLEALRSALGG